MRYTSAWVTPRGRVALTVAALAVTLTSACGPAARQDSRATGASGDQGSQRWGTAATPTATPTKSGSAQGGVSLSGTVTMQRSGGFAGVMQSVEIAADGAWTYTDRRAGTVRHGRLSQLERERLARTLADPALAREQAASSSVGVCSDGYLYQITWGSLRAKFVWCGSVGNRPALVAVVTVIEDATPM